MAEIDLLRGLPQTRRNIAARTVAKAENRALAMRFGREYFDGPREQGYGGYRYDGRWIPVARDIIAHFRLRPGDRVLDVGCAKGFLVKDLMDCCPGLEVFGLDISEYALMNCMPDTIGRLHLGTAEHLPFPDRSFQTVLSINTLHNLDADGCARALREIERIGDGRAFVQVDAYRTPEEKRLFEDWMLTAKTYHTPAGWIDLFSAAGYTGDHYWTIIAG